MRKAYTTKWLRDSDNILGVSLSGNFCSEHEIGIKQIQKSFKMRETPKRFKHLSINTIPEDELYFVDDGTYAVLLFDFNLNPKRSHIPSRTKLIKESTVQDFLEQNGLVPREGQDLWGAWSNEDFCICAKGQRRKALRKIYNGFLDKDISIWYGYFVRDFDGTLNIAVTSEIPKEFKKVVNNTFLEKELLKKEADKTKIESVLKEAGKKWFALSPKFIKEEDKKGRNTKYDVVFWLNPQRQDINDFGWYTVEELQQWAKDEGPVLKT
jgi:hypothetical protein